MLLLHLHRLLWRKNDLIRGFMKRKIDVSDVLKEAWGLTVDYFFVWTAGLAIIQLPFFILGLLILFFSPLTSTFLPSIILLGFLCSFVIAYIHKFSLTMVRNPQMVRRNFWRAVGYSISDGFFGRLLSMSIYVFIFFLAMLLLFVYFYNVLMPDANFQEIMGTWLIWVAKNQEKIASMLFLLFLIAPMFNLVFHLFYSYFIVSHFFLLPYIIQDTNSSDNLLRPLSAFGSLGKSFSRMNGQRGRYLLVELVLKLIPVVLGLIEVLSLLFGDGISNVVGMIVSMINGFLLIYALAARSVMADILMSYDREIVNFGD